MRLNTFVLSSLVFPLFLALPSLAQGPAAPGCGNPKTKFDVKAGKPQPALQPEPGKALIYFLQDDSDFVKRPRPTTRIGMDGTWLGATHANSYVSFSVEPGIHHLCASWQWILLENEDGTAVLHLTTEPGATYYLLAKNRLTSISFDPIDSDEGKLLMSRFAVSDSNPKK